MGSWEAIVSEAFDPTVFAAYVCCTCVLYVNRNTYMYVSEKERILGTAFLAISQTVCMLYAPICCLLKANVSASAPVSIHTNKYSIYAHVLGLLSPMLYRAPQKARTPIYIYIYIGVCMHPPKALLGFAKHIVKQITY